MDISTSLFLWASSLVSGGVSLALEIGLLVVALGPVAKHRPEASLLLAGAAGLNLFLTIVHFVAPSLLMALLDVSRYAAVHAALALFTTLLHGLSGVLLLMGILRLAVPANRDPTRYG